MPAFMSFGECIVYLAGRYASMLAFNVHTCEEPFSCDSVRDHRERICLLTVHDSSRGSTIFFFRKSRSHPKILDAGEVTGS